MRIIVSNDVGEWFVKEADGWNPFKHLSRRFNEWASDDYKEAMENLRKVDGEIRVWVGDLKSWLKAARTAKKHGRWIDIIFYLNQINGRLMSVTESGKSIKDIRDEQINKFYMGRGEDNAAGKKYPGNLEKAINPNNSLDSKEWLEDGRDVHGINAEDDYLGMQIQAGLFDGTKRWLANRQLDKMYKNRLAKQRTAVKKLMETTEATIQRASEHLSDMAEYRDHGEIENYLKSLDGLAKVQQNFQKTFLAIFNENFKEEITKLQEVEDEKKMKDAPAISKEMLERHPSIFEDQFKGNDTLGKTHNSPVTQTGTIPSAPLPAEEEISAEVPAMDAFPDLTKTEVPVQPDLAKTEVPVQPEAPAVQEAEGKLPESTEPKVDDVSVPTAGPSTRPEDLLMEQTTEPSAASAVPAAPAATPAIPAVPKPKKEKKNKPAKALAMEKVLEGLSKMSSVEDMVDTLMIFSTAADDNGRPDLAAEFIMVAEELLAD